MSWSVSATGRSDEVLKQIEKQFADMEAHPCPEPEETIKKQAAGLIASALGGNEPVRDVTVSAWGSQSTWSEGEGQPQKVANSLSISIS